MCLEITLKQLDNETDNFVTLFRWINACLLIQTFYNNKGMKDEWYKIYEYDILRID